MSPMLRRLLAVMAALVVAGVTITIIETFASQLQPLPPGVDPHARGALRLALEHGQVPFASLALILAGWLLAGYLGGAIASRYGRSGSAGVLFAGLFTVVVFARLSAMPHPTWMWIGGLGACPLFALGGSNRTLTVPRTT